MRPQGVSKQTGNLVVLRDGQCVVRVTHPGVARSGQQIHHRRPRAMGGSEREHTNDSCNLIYLCRACHDWIESNRAEAYSKGWLLTQRQDPKTEPLLYLGRWMYLDCDGQVLQFLAEPWKDA